MAYVLAMHPGNRLRQLRKARDLTQGALGELVGMDQDRISNYENGRRPLTLAHLRAFARALACSVADLLDDDDNPERLSDEERSLLQAFREVDGAARDVILTSAQAVAERRTAYRARDAA